MPLLNAEGLARLRDDQKREALEHRTCANCTAQIWKNYCRECDDTFTDGHYDTCAEYTPHQEHRTY